MSANTVAARNEYYGSYQDWWNWVDLSAPSSWKAIAVPQLQRSIVGLACGRISRGHQP